MGQNNEIRSTGNSPKTPIPEPASDLKPLDAASGMKPQGIVYESAKVMAEVADCFKLLPTVFGSCQFFLDMIERDKRLLGRESAPFDKPFDGFRDLEEVRQILDDLQYQVAEIRLWFKPGSPYQQKYLRPTDLSEFRDLLHCGAQLYSTFPALIHSRTTEN